jgi:hypothetical protein
VRLPRRAPRQNVYLTADQLDRLAEESGRYRSLVLALGVDGLRWGEAAAMTLDVYVDLFDSDLSSVAESVAKMWPRQAISQ